MSILIYNSYDAANRAYIASTNLSQFSLIIDWNVNVDAAEAYLAAGGTSPSSFPFITSLPVQPNLLGFKTLVLNDTNIPMAAKLTLYQYTAVLNDLVSAIESGIDPEGTLDAVWQQIVANESNLQGNCLDGTTTIVNQLLSYAQATGIPL